MVGGREGGNERVFQVQLKNLAKAISDCEETKKMHNRTFRLISVNGKAGYK